MQAEQVPSTRKQVSDSSAHKCSLLSLVTQGVIKLIRGSKVLKGWIISIEMPPGVGLKRKTNRNGGNVIIHVHVYSLYIYSWIFVGKWWLYFKTFESIRKNISLNRYLSYKLVGRTLSSWQNLPISYRFVYNLSRYGIKHINSSIDLVVVFHIQF